ncbi:hypothetical protein HGRIS_013031 [Hohenbuehelia grisea]|uniref:DUF4211 domain-containing protein n=1 Tax=Hohenbuehelia grisea TaxID=104357 RepID=A0ABR3IU54_9AGAR
MARPKRQTTGKQPSKPRKLKQTTLFEALSSSPPRASGSRRDSSDVEFQPTILLASSPSSRPSQRKRRHISLTVSSDDEDSDVNAIRLAPRPKDVIAVSDSDHASEAEESPKRSTAKKRKHVVGSDNETKPFALCSNLHESDHDSDELPVRRVSRKGKARQVADSDDDSEPKPKRRRLIKGTKRDTPPLEEGDLADEVDEDKILDSRMRKRGKLTAFQKNLEKLKRRKQGKKALESSESEEADSQREDSDTAPFEGARPDVDDNDSDDQVGSGEDVEDGFIVEDDGTLLAELPPEFSMQTHEDLAHQFKKIFQFFVHIAVRHPDEHHDFMEDQIKSQQYFSVPLQMVRRKLAGLRDSLVASSVWRSEFKRALGKYPEFNLEDLQFAVPACDACHLGGRLSTRIGRLSGNSYDPTGFKDLPETPAGSEDDDSGADESPTKTFHLGRFCARRTQVYHQFTHWEVG